MNTPKRYVGPYYLPTNVSELNEHDLIECCRLFFDRYPEGENAPFEIAEFGYALIEEMRHRNLWQ